MTTAALRQNGFYGEPIALFTGALLPGNVGLSKVVKWLTR
jgi:hypothetical protein